MLLLEELERAKHRWATIYGELSSFGPNPESRIPNPDFRAWSL
jgi:hypothetical protein